MCRGSSHAFLASLPKCEHHIHLEGALTPEVLFKLARKNQIELPADDDAFSSPATLQMRYSNFTSLDDCTLLPYRIFQNPADSLLQVLHYYYIGMSVLIDSSDFEALAWDYFQHAKKDGVMHAECM